VCDNSAKVKSSEVWELQKEDWLEKFPLWWKYLCRNCLMFVRVWKVNVLLHCYFTTILNFLVCLRKYRKLDGWKYGTSLLFDK
jgi:hypothetical protein